MDPEHSPRLVPVLAYMNSPEGRARMEAHQEECRKRDNGRVRAYRNARLGRDAGFRRLCSWRSKFSSCLFKKWAEPGAESRGRSDATMRRLVGCGWAEMRRHIESQFAEGMTWENHGRKGWNVDHRRPAYEFDWMDDRSFAEMNHWSNLRPVWAVEHRAKSLVEARLAREERNAGRRRR